MVVWIEIYCLPRYARLDGVTTCVVVWIEISCDAAHTTASSVTTCVVVWIEMVNDDPSRIIRFSHHLRGGVD